MSNTQEHEKSELDKILEKAFADIRKRMISLMAIQEKKIMKELKITNKTSKKYKAKPKPEKEHRHGSASSTNSE